MTYRRTRIAASGTTAPRPGWLVKLALLFALVTGASFAQGEPDQLSGEWRRMGDEFEGMVIRLKRVGDSYEGRIVRVPAEARQYKFQVGDVKWRRFRKYTAKTYYFQDLFSTGSGQMQYYGAHLEIISHDEISITNISTMDLSVGLHQKWVRVPESEPEPKPAQPETRPEPRPEPPSDSPSAANESDGDGSRSSEAVADVSWVLNIRFKPNSDELVTNSLGSLNELVGFMQEHPGLVIRVEGHTDKVKEGGDPDFNLDLSKRRAEAVRRYLIASEIEPERIEAQGYGDTDLMVEGYDPRNRRVVIHVLRAD